MTDTTTAAKKTRGGRPQARPVPRPAPDHGHDPAEPTPVVTADQPPAATAAATAEPKATTRRPPAAKQAPATTPAAAPVTRERRPTATSRRVAAETDGARYPARVPLMTSVDQKRALELARVEDGITATARVRAMITLWQDDERIRRRVDKMARNQVSQDQLAR